MTAYNNLDRILSPSVCNIEIQLITQSLVNVTRGAFGFYKLTTTPPMVSRNNNSKVKPVRLDDDTEGYSCSRIKTINYASYTHLVRMVKILRCRHPEVLA